jgi:hypothetical protein
MLRKAISLTASTDAGAVQQEPDLLRDLLTGPGHRGDTQIWPYGGRRARLPSRVYRSASLAAFGTKVRVTNRRDGHSVVVLINDHAPLVRSAVIDMTPAAARALGFSGIILRC